MPIRILTRGAKNGKCNICGVDGKLTDDHTPPKCCTRIGAVELHHITERLKIERSGNKGRYSQNGVKYRTLCAKCNSEILGGLYDPEFCLFVNQISSYMTSQIEIPPTMFVKAKPQKIMRSLMGHMSAQGINRYGLGKISGPISDYILDAEQPLPDFIKIYYWPYPFKNQVMARNCGLLDLSVGDTVVVWFLKFFPVAFFITFNEPPGYRFDMAELSKWGSENLAYEAELPIYFRDILHEYWPESPADDAVVMYGDDAITSYEIPKK